MNFLKFRRLYGLEMLPVSHSEISLGDLAWKPKVGRLKLVKRGMPNHIYNVFLTLDLVNYKDWLVAMDYFEDQTTIPANMGNLHIQAHHNFSKTLHHPVVELIEAQFKHDKEHQFGFSEIRARVLTNAWRIKIQKLIDAIPAVKAAQFFKRSRPIHIVTELYYGNITYTTDRRGSMRLDLLLRKHKEKTINRYLNQRERIYVFSHQNVPFAMRIEALDGFKA